MKNSLLLGEAEKEKEGIDDGVSDGTIQARSGSMAWLESFMVHNTKAWALLAKGFVY